MEVWMVMTWNIDLDEYAGCRWQSSVMWRQHILVMAVEWAEKDTDDDLVISSLGSTVT